MKDYAGPHFDDEQTLRAAQPVVPLQEINTKTRRLRRLFLAGAFAVAMMLGAGSALLASYLKLRNAPPVTAAATEQELEFEPEPVVVAESVQGETPVVEEEEITPPPVTPKRESSVRRRTVAPRNSAHSDDGRDTEELSEEDELQRIRRAVLYDEWQERRARRVSRRERRRAERYNHRDLSNLDEIFEGRRRP